MIAKDIQLDYNNDLLIYNGDFKIDSSDIQHIEDIIKAYPGWYKEFIQLGVGVKSYVGSAGMQQQLQRIIKLQLQADNYNIIKLTTEQKPDGTFNITINAKRDSAIINTVLNVGA